MGATTAEYSRIEFDVDSPQIDRMVLSSNDVESIDLFVGELIQPALDAHPSLEEFESDLNSYSRHYDSLESIDNLYILSLCFQYSLYKVDLFIDDNGLRPVINEVKQRRWVMMLALTMYAAVT